MSRKGKHRKKTKTEVQPSAEITLGIRKSIRSPVQWLVLGIIILSVALIRLGLLNVPLERDEGEYAYIGRLILEGTAPYVNAYNMKLPGTYAMYAILMLIFGKSIAGIHIGLLFINAGSIIFFFLGFRKLFNAPIALFTCGVYGIMSVSPALLGFAAHATQFVVFFVSCGIFFLAKYFDRTKPANVFLAGLMFGLSFLMKQQAVFYILFGGLVVLIPLVVKKSTEIWKLIRYGIIYSVGALIPYSITLLIFLVAGAFDKFWFWTFSYASKYVSGVSLGDGLKLFSISFKPIWQEFAFFWILFFAGLVVLFISKLELRQKLVALLFSIFSFLSICPGFYFRRHYFVCLIPAIGLLGGITVYYCSKLFEKNFRFRSDYFLPVALLLIVTISVVSKQKEYYLQPVPEEISRNIYGLNPFVESPEIASYIDNNTTSKDKIAILGSEPEILFYADRKSATGYIYTYGLMEIHEYNLQMQNEMISEIEKNIPAMIVFCNIPTSWLKKPESPGKIFEWANKYIAQNYELSGIADILGKSLTVYRWGNDVKNYQLKSKEYVLVYKRKPS